MRRPWDTLNVVVGYTGGWIAAYLLGGRGIFAALCGLAGSFAWVGIAEVITLRVRARNERIQRGREMRRDHS